jgi:hypothetical protein
MEMIGRWKTLLYKKYAIENINARFLVQVKTAFYPSVMAYMVSPRGIKIFSISTGKSSTYR